MVSIEIMTSKDLVRIFWLNHPRYGISRMIGIFSLLLIISGCQTVLNPEQVTTSFWKAMSNSDLESAIKYTTLETQYLVAPQENIKEASLETGMVVINGPNAKVSTVITLKNPENNKLLTFDTILLKQNDIWKVNYRETLNSLSILPFGEVFNSLRAIGDVINKKLEQQMPFIENQIRSFSDELIRQLDEFRQQMEKAIPPEKQKFFPPGGI